MRYRNRVQRCQFARFNQTANDKCYQYIIDRPKFGSIVFANELHVVTFVQLLDRKMLVSW